jgi:hypothetical protein
MWFSDEKREEVRGWLEEIQKDHHVPYEMRKFDCEASFLAVSVELKLTRHRVHPSKTPSTGLPLDLISSTSPSAKRFSSPAR